MLVGKLSLDRVVLGVVTSGHHSMPLALRSESELWVGSIGFLTTTTISVRVNFRRRRYHEQHRLNGQKALNL